MCVCVCVYVCACVRVCVCVLVCIQVTHVFVCILHVHVWQGGRVLQLQSTHLPTINFVLISSGSCSRISEDGRTIAIGIVIDDVDSLNIIKKAIQSPKHGLTYIGKFRGKIFTVFTDWLTTLEI